MNLEGGDKRFLISCVKVQHTEETFSTLHTEMKLIGQQKPDLVTPFVNVQNPFESVTTPSGHKLHMISSG